jgi:hypothetical protein
MPCDPLHICWSKSMFHHAWRPSLSSTLKSGRNLVTMALSSSSLFGREILHSITVL